MDSSPRAWIALSVVTVALVTGAGGAAGAQAPEAGHFDPMAFLVGSCWKGTFPDGKATDEHCYEWIWGGKFIRDRHVVRGPKPDYEGETVFAWDAQKKQIVFWYFTNQGFYTTGSIEPKDEGLVVAETVVAASTPSEMKTVLRPNGPDSYLVRSQGKDGASWKELWSMELKRVQAK
jgi:hypothetical protein